LNCNPNKKTVGRNKIELAWPNWKTKHTLQNQRALNHKNAKNKIKIKKKIRNNIVAWKIKYFFFGMITIF
jgi:Fe-S cluster biosynthesis and repair protein YggX